MIGIAGTDEKCRCLEDDLGFDKAINYKSADLERVLKDAPPNGVDLYFENTGGPVQHITFVPHECPHGRIIVCGMIVCGMIADYNTDKPSPGPNWLNIIRKRMTITGFAMPDHWTMCRR